MSSIEGEKRLLIPDSFYSHYLPNWAEQHASTEIFFFDFLHRDVCLKYYFPFVSWHFIFLSEKPQTLLKLCMPVCHTSTVFSWKRFCLIGSTLSWCCTLFCFLGGRFHTNGGWSCSDCVYCLLCGAEYDFTGIWFYSHLFLDMLQWIAIAI